MASQTSQAASDEERLDALILDISRRGPSRTTLDQLDANSPSAHQYIDDMHAWLIASPVHHPLRRNIIYLLKLVCCRTRRTPRQLELSGVTLDGQNPPLSRTLASVVYRGWHNEQEIVVKRWILLEDDYKYFVRETLTWFYSKHPHILSLQGIVLDPNLIYEPGLVSRWQEHGNLADYVASDHYKNSPGRRKEIACQIAQGLAYLHSWKVVHGDIKDTNIVVSSEHKALIADFGLAIVGDVTAGRYTTTGTRGTNRWLSPERYANPRARRDASMDVYAFGCICYMLCTGHAPFHDLPEDSFREMIKTDDLPHLDTNVIELDFVELIKATRVSEAADRMTMFDVLAYFGLHQEKKLGS